MKNNVEHAESISEAIESLQTFLECDMYTKFRPETKIKGEKWYRQDWFRNEKEFSEYLEGHFDILRKEIRRLGKNPKWKIKKH